MKFCARLWLLGLLLTSKLLAQPFTSRTLSLQQGLPEYFVSGIVQDKAGFIWVATRDGLARYDGRQFKVFRHQPYGNHSLASNVIASLKSLSDTTMLLQLEGGTLQLFNPITERFGEVISARLQHQSHKRLENPTLSADEKQVWGWNQTQINRFDRQTKHVTTYPIPLSAITRPYPSTTYSPDERHRLYAPLPGRLIQFDTQTGTFHSWYHPLIGQPGPIETYYGIPFLERTSGDILISAAQQLLLFNARTQQFRSLPIPGPIHTQVGLLYQAPGGQVYFTYGMSVYRLSADDQITPIWTAPRQDYQNYFHALLLDRSGVLWIGTNGDGVQQLDLRALPINAYHYRTNFVADVLVELGIAPPAWAKTNAHIYRLRWGGSTPFISVGFTGESYQLLRRESGHHQLQRLLVLPRDPSRDKTRNGPDEEGNGLRILPDGTIWMYDPDQGLLKADTTGRLLDTFACSINRVSSLYPGGDLIWLGSETDGLYAYDLNKRRIVRHLHYQPADPTSLISDHVLCMAPDPANQSLLWVGTQEGLSRLDTRTMRCQNWTQKQGLPSTTINTLLTDRRGNLWFSTGKGISRLDPKTGRLRHFSTADGLLDIEYRQNHAVQLPDGRLAFGGATGIAWFDPLALSETALPIPTVLTGLRIGNVPIEPGTPDSLLRQPLNATSSLQLTYRQNFLSLEFAGLQYNKPTTLQYRYQLTGVDADWVYVGNQTLANYTQLAPGNYTFRVNTADALNHWSPLVKIIRIRITPPWWQTNWAYGFYALLLVGLVWTYRQYRSNQTALRQQMALQEQEARLIQENADWQTRFFTNITHEFRTPLTLIINPLERLIESAPPPLQQPYGVMHRNAQRLLRLINQLLDIAKLEAGQLMVSEVRGNLPHFFAQLIDSFRPRADKKGLQLTYEATGLRADYRFDAHKLETIGYNLLANAIKFTPSGGEIGVRLTQETGPDGRPDCQLRITDTGPGIPPEQLPRIFERFFQGQTDTTTSGRGTGIGLFLVAEFSKLLGGTLSVESQLGQGTTFIVTLPLQKASESEPSLETQVVDRVSYPEAAPEKSVGPASSPLVLVVEDNDELRAFIAQELAPSYRVLTAADGQEGWQLCLTELPELVISDVMMPRLDGFSLLERIKTTPLTAHIAVILLTAKTMTESRIQGLSAGANDYLTKPFHGPELLLRIANLLAHQQQLRQHWQQRMSQLTTPLADPVADDPFLVKFYAVIEGELANVSFSIEQLADELAVSQRTLQRKLSTLTGKNAIELLRAYRLQQAAQLLGQGHSVSDVAEKVGFDGVSYFSKSFKAQFGVSPSAYGLAQRRP